LPLNVWFIPPAMNSFPPYFIYAPTLNVVLSDIDVDDPGPLLGAEGLNYYLTTGV